MRYISHSRTTFLLGCIFGGLCAGAVPLLVQFFAHTAQADTKLLPFQGRLTDAAGNTVGDGAEVVEFKMYDAPTGGAVKWAGEVHKLSVNGGLVNTMLGSKASLGSVDFSTPTFLQITIDANNDNQITAADPPLLPRQSVQGSVYAVEAGNSRALGTHPVSEYQAIFDGANPTSGQILGTKIKPQSLPMTVFAPDSITAAQLADNSVGATELASGSVDSAAIIDGEIKGTDLADASVSWSKRAPRVVRKSTGAGNIPVANIGEIAISAEANSPALPGGGYVAVPGLEAGIVSGGGAIRVVLGPVSNN